MVKHTDTIWRLSPTNCVSVFDHFVGLALKRLKDRYDKNESQWAFASSKLTIETLEQGVKYVQS